MNNPLLKLQVQILLYNFIFTFVIDKQWRQCLPIKAYQSLIFRRPSLFPIVFSGSQPFLGLAVLPIPNRVSLGGSQPVEGVISKAADVDCDDDEYRNNPFHFNQYKKG